MGRTPWGREQRRDDHVAIADAPFHVPRTRRVPQEVRDRGADPSPVGDTREEKVQIDDASEEFVQAARQCSCLATDASSERVRHEEEQPWGQFVERLAASVASIAFAQSAGAVAASVVASVVASVAASAACVVACAGVPVAAFAGVPVAAFAVAPVAACAVAAFAVVAFAVAVAVEASAASW